MTPTDTVVRWEDYDQHLIRYRELKEEKAIREQLPRVISREHLDAPVRRFDEYADAAVRSLTATVEPGMWALSAERAHEDYQRRQKEAQMMVRLADKAGEPVDPEIRRLATTPSAHLQVEAILETRAENRRAAVAEASRALAAPVPVDRSMLRHVANDPWGRALEGEQMMSDFPQVQAHRRMAEGKPTPATRSEPRPEKRGLFGRRKSS